MDGNHPKNKGTHPRRAKAKDNPYTIYTTGSDNDHPKYILEFTDGQKRPLRLEIDQALYELFDQFELEDKRFLNEVDRHYEHIDLTEAEIEHRAAFPKESLEEEIGRVLLYEELHKGIAQLTQTQQRRLALYYFHGLTYEQIAAAEGCRYQAVRDSVHPANFVPLLQRIAGTAVVGEPAIDLIHPSGLTADIEFIQIRNSLDVGAVVNGCPT